MSAPVNPTPQPPQWALDAAKDALFQIYGSNLIADANKDFVGAIIAKHHAASQRWIPCAERLPDLHYLAVDFCIYGSMQVRRGNFDVVTTEFIDHDNDCAFPADCVTHWQPAPELPAPPR